MDKEEKEELEKEEFINIEDIKSIITHEQMEEMEYRV